MADQNKWLGLMKWSMKYSDGTMPSDFKQISKEDKEFLEKVMKEGVIDEAERITQILRILDGEDPHVVFAKEGEDELSEKVNDEELADYKEGLLDELLTRIDQIDNAMNFVKMHGLHVLKNVITENERASTRALAAEVCSVVVQNVPFCQDAAVKVGMLEVLCRLAKDDNATCQAKALLAISCLVRHHEGAEARFLSESCDGLNVLKSFLQEKDDIRLQRKSIFFLRYLITNSKSTAQKVLAADFYLQTIAKFISNDDIDLCESCLQGLTEFVDMGPEFAAACKKDEFDIVSKLSSRMQQIEALEGEDKEFYGEIFNMTKNLKTKLTA